MKYGFSILSGKFKLAEILFFSTQNSKLCLVSRSPEYNEGNSEESDIIEILRRGVYPEPQILRRFAPQNDMGEGLLRMTLRELFTNASHLTVS